MSATAHGTAEHRIEQVRTFLNGFPNNGADQLTAFIGATYIEHAPALSDRLAGQRAHLASVPEESRVRIVRIFADGDYVVAHSEYSLFGPKVAFDVYRFQGERVVEHWSNVQDKCSTPNVSGRTQLDGPVPVQDLDQTRANKELVQAYFNAVVFGGQRDRIPAYRYVEDFRQHNCAAGDIKGGVPTKGGTTPAFKIEKVHRILGQGNFVLVMSEGVYDGMPTAFFDLYRLQDGKQVEHWDVIEDLPAPGASKNQDGKF